MFSPLKLLIINPFPPGTNPNPHLISYVGSAASRVLGHSDLHIARFADAVSYLPESNAVLIFGSLAHAISEVSSLSKVCKRMNLPLCYWSTDDPYEIDVNLECRDFFDWIWTNDKASIQFYDMEEVEHLPLAADPQVHCLPFPDEESFYWYDVSFVGVEFPNRRELLEKLKPLLEALDTAVIGPNWTLEARFIKKTRVSNQEAAQISNRSRIVLNMSRSFDPRLMWANIRGIVPSTPGPRTFEAGGCSTVQLVTWDQPEIEEYYLPEKEVIFCDGLDDIKEQIHDLVTNRERRRAIAESSFKRTKACHLYDHRLQEISARIDTLIC